MAKPNGRGGWDLTDEDVAEVMATSFPERLVVKIVIETDIGEILVVRTVRVRDDLMKLDGGDKDRHQDAFLGRVKRAATAAYIEAVGK